ncbi:transcription repressor NadR [Priestia endophytica]|uniref:transcription repressor NadR n=1 Tax=Priestia endophytica TaxID=135735 RepID=UPI0022811EFD|nr:transcription repressor NadR [Priestia endophytica]MCY8233632.1 transcription repressor NadR [Priestia endophytica]
MKDEQKKILGEKRRDLLLQWLKDSNAPLTGSDLSKRTNVSRQVIVQDISLLKARNEPIMATSQGYLYMSRTQAEQKQTRIIACKHGPDESERELLLLVDHGVTVKDVIVEHSVYGELTASLGLRNRKDVANFIDKIRSAKAAFLLELTKGGHLHTVEADSSKQLDEACDALRKAGILVEE